MSGRACVAGLVLWIAGTSLPAQEDGPTHEWAFDGFRQSLCIEFLMEATPADKRLPKGFLPVAASRFSPLHPALRRLITEEPLYAAWIPAILCAYASQAVVVDGRRIVEGGGGGGGSDTTARPMVGVWGIAGTPEGEQRDSLWVLPLFFTTNNRIRRAAETGLLSIRVIDETMETVPESPEDRYEIKIGKTRLTWDGHLAGDSVPDPAPIRHWWWLKGRRGSTWRVEVELRPRWSRPTVGALRVEGKDDLAKALKASPIRMLGPAFWGGGGGLQFRRQ